MEAAFLRAFPHVHQQVGATLGLYAGVWALMKTKNALFGDDEPEAVEAVAAPVSAVDASDDIPSIADERFDAWASQGDNMKRWEDSLESYEG